MAQPTQPPPSQPPQQQLQQHPHHQQQQQQPAARRPMCAGCGRPLRVCWCSALPPQPVELKGRVLLLQHPLETKRALATVPLLAKALSPASLSVCVGRRLQRSKWAALDQLLAQAVEQQGVPLLVLFPGPGAKSLQDVAQDLHAQHAADDQAMALRQQQQAQTQQEQQQQEQQQQEQQPPRPAYVLLVVDGTWQHAREMFDAMQGQLGLCDGPAGAASLVTAQQVQLPRQDTPQLELQPQQPQQPQQQEGGEGGQPVSPPPPLLLGSGCRLRTEPAPGCCSTAEAVAAAVALLEDEPQLFEVLMAPLRLLTQHQAAFDPAVAARMQPGGSGVVPHKTKLGMRGMVD